MTHTAVHYEFVSMGFNRKRRVSFPHDIYQVVVKWQTLVCYAFSRETYFHVLLNR